jgi:hypothetical protein
VRTDTLCPGACPPRRMRSDVERSIAHPRASGTAICFDGARTSASTRFRLPFPASNRHRRELLGAPLLRLVDKPERMVYDGDIRGFVGVGVT